MPRSFLCAVAIVLLVVQAAGHGGTLHPGGPEQNGFLRSKVASCSKWVPASGVIKQGKVVAAPTAPKPTDVKGTVTLWQYLYKNCSVAEGEDPSAGAVFNVSITRSGKALSGVTLDGVGMTGSCADNGGAVFFFNPDKTPVDDKENKLWFTNYTTLADGKVAGNGANDGLIRTVTKGDRAAVKSVVLVEMKTNTIISCCDVTPAGPASTNWVKALEGKGKVCEEEGHSAHSPAASRLANGTAGNATMADDHAGHDHAGHNHTEHDHNTTAPAKPAGGAKSAAGSVAAGVSGAMGAAAAAVVLLML